MASACAPKLGRKVVGRRRIGEPERAWKGEHQLLGYLEHSVLSLAATGVFGFCVCVMRVLWFVTERAIEGERTYVLMVALRESLNVPSAATMFVAVSLTLTSIGKRRFPLPNPSAVPR